MNIKNVLSGVWSFKANVAFGCDMNNALINQKDVINSSNY